MFCEISNDDKYVKKLSNGIITQIPELNNKLKIGE